jgi:glycosyltransferase involved in cell wall biosynthesis
MSPRVVFGMTLYNNARHLPAALESLLAQTDPDFGLVMVDDASSDATEAVARAYVERDRRLRYVRHAARRGMVPSWRNAFEQSVTEFPSATAFAWASDHDWWHPEWLARVGEALRSRVDVVLAYALTQRVDDALQPLDKPPKAFDTTALDGPAQRVLAFASEPVGAGDMVYGLMRIDALRRAGVFRPVMQPDRLLMIELALAGRFAQVPEVLWLRRQPATPSVTKQRSTLFAEKEAPRGLDRPVWWQHGAVLLREYAGRRRLPGVAPVQIAAVLARYQAIYLFRHHNKEGYVLHRLGKTRERLNQQRKEARKELHWAAYRTRRTLRPEHLARLAEKHWLHLWNRGIYQAAVARRRTRAGWYETRTAARKHYGRARRAARRVLHDLLVMTHRLGLRHRS